MSAGAKIRTICPLCDSSYQVAAARVGQQARCGHCHGTFQIAERVTHPTEEDILRWINEGMEEYFDRMDHDTVETRIDAAQDVSRTVTPDRPHSPPVSASVARNRLDALEHDTARSSLHT